ncbi:MAG TPA: cupin domain-containing protein [Aggregatilineaceae bacterium]|nr:cupin domain-containing protein [Aggregatilineaceae bacterium]
MAQFLAVLLMLLGYGFLPTATASPGVINDLEWSPDGNTLAVAASRGVWLVDPDDLSSRLISDDGNQMWDVAYSPDGKLIAGAGQDGKTRVWDTGTLELVATLGGHPWRVDSVLFSPDGTMLLSGSGGGDGLIQVWDTRTYEHITTLEGHNGTIAEMRFSGTRLATASHDSTARVWDVATWEPLVDVTDPSAELTSLRFLPDQAAFITGGTEGRVRIWDATTGEIRAVLDDQMDHVLSLDLTADGRYLATGSKDKTVRIWDINSGDGLDKLPDQPHWINAVAFSPDDTRLAIGNANGVIQIIQNPVKDAQTITADRGTINRIALSPDGSMLVAAGSRGVWVYDTDDLAQEPRHYYTGQSYSAAFSPDGSKLAYDVKGPVVICEAATGETILTIAGTRYNESLAFSPDGSQIVSGGHDFRIRVWDARTGEPLAVMRARGELMSLVFTPDGQQLISASNHDRNLHVWDVTSGETVQLLAGHTHQRLMGVAFSPVGHTLASVSYDGTVRLWDVAGWENTAVLEGHTDWVMSVAYSPDGRLIASGSRDGTVRLWDATSGEPVAVLGSHAHWVIGVAFSPDGHTLYTACADGSLRRWEMPVKNLTPSNPPLQPSWRGGSQEQMTVNAKEQNMADVINMAEKFGLIQEYWSPRIAGELNDSYVKLAKIKGEFVWHHHENEDELFLVIKGRLVIQLRDRELVINEGEFVIIPRGVEHRPVAEEEVQIMLLEPKTTVNTGNVQNERTVDNQWI